MTTENLTTARFTIATFGTGKTHVATGIAPGEIGATLCGRDGAAVPAEAEPVSPESALAFSNLCSRCERIVAGALRERMTATKETEPKKTAKKTARGKTVRAKTGDPRADRKENGSALDAETLADDAAERDERDRTERAERAAKKKPEPKPEPLSETALANFRYLAANAATPAARAYWAAKVAR